MSNGVTTQVEDAYAIVVCLGGVAQETSNLGHSLDANNALNSEIGLVRKRARKVVRAELCRGDERVRDQEPSPLIKQSKL